MKTAAKTDYHNAYLREKKARERAETLLEIKARELFEKNEILIAQQDYLIQSEKMASLGQLAAGIAHEINNPLSFASSNVNTLEEYLTTLRTLLKKYEECVAEACDPTKLKKNSEHITQYTKEQNIRLLLENVDDVLTETKEGMVRVKNIVAGLKSFSHVGEQEYQLADINEIVESALRLTMNDLKYECTVETILVKAPKVACHPDQLCQVLINLLTNASHAVGSDGRVKIETSAHEKDVWVTVTDNGHGIPKDIQKELFNPFFTTKPIGEGTGLGLSISFGIIENHGGTIEVESQLNKGTTFTVKLPVGEKI